ncbi:MAG: RibD family protein [Anaerolineales bacterium]|jgi:3,4-dihydroxy 2-butanone 4-phosphate synthase/GTP cyclohydrolase II
MNDPVEATLHAQKQVRTTSTRPFVCLSYAQSLDASISAQPGKPTAISSPESLSMTHQMRALHDCILIGINTALSDDPQLSVRLVEGQDPVPVILDSELRLKPDSRMLSPSRTVRIFCAHPIDEQRAEPLIAAGASIHTVPTTSAGFLQISNVLSELSSMGYRSVMVEGGANVITEFLSARAVDWMVITIGSLLLGGLRVPLAPPEAEAWSPVRLDLKGAHFYGPDLVVWGQPKWELQ